jgi:proline-specific peptidase
VRVSVGDVQLYLEIFGQERRPVLLGLHGGPGNDGTALRYRLAPLADVAQVVVPDQRGHGRSDHASAETWNLETWATDVHGLAGALEIEHPVVLGISFGGFVAQAYAARWPAEPRALVLVSTIPRAPDPEETIERFREVGGDEAAEVMRREWETPSEATAADWKRVCGPLTSLRRDPELERIRSERIETVDVGIHFNEELKTFDLRDGLRSVRCPALVLVGERDPLVPLRLARELVESLPDGLGRLELVEDASHDVFADNPDVSYGLVREFLGEVSR